MRTPLFCLIVFFCACGSKNEPQSSDKSIQELIAQDDSLYSDTTQKESLYNYRPELAMDKNSFVLIAGSIEELHMPAKISIPDSVSSGWIELDENQKKLFIADYWLENKPWNVYAMNKIEMAKGTGILFYLKSAETSSPDEDIDLDAVSDRVLLVLYNRTPSYSNDLLLSEQAPTSYIFSVMRSIAEIVVMEESESEDIHIERRHYSVDGTSVTTGSTENAVFNSSQSGRDAADEYASEYERKWIGEK